MLEKLLNRLNITNTRQLSAADFHFYEHSDSFHKSSGAFGHITYGWELVARVEITRFFWIIEMTFIKHAERGSNMDLKKALSKIKGHRMFVFSPTKEKCLALVRDQIFVPKKR